ncbi:MAG: DUF488 domain-containing protein [Alphaproteobacteria bacterium]|nr:DUF488 domain-containing protein [Alphaproteobacteria bacterium]
MTDIYSIGHSNHPAGHFLSLLHRHRITALADVRTTPYSRFNPQFRREALAQSLQGAGIAYVFLGEELGGKRQGVTQAEIARSESFQRGLARLRQGAERYKVAFMCAEREPLDCHRTILVARHLKAPDLAIRHILADGRIEEHESVERRLVEQTGLAPPPLMAGDPQAWAEAVERAYEQRAREWFKTS